MRQVRIFLTIVFAVFTINECAVPIEKIVFTKEYYYDNPPIQLWCSDLWVMNTDGLGIQQLTNLGVPYTAETPMLSPDGQWIAFASSYNSWRSAYYKDIFAVSTNGTQLTRITGNENTTPVGYCTIEGLIIDNTQRDPLNEIQINITHQGSNQFYHPTKVTNRTFSYSIPNVPLPFGGKIWVKCCVSQYIGNLIFPVVYADQVNTIEDMHLKEGNYLAVYPGWSPDMTKLCGDFAYSCYDPVDSQFVGVDHIAVWGIEGTQLDTRSTGYPFDCHPRFSPDGTKIAFGYGPAFQQSLVTVPSNNLNATPTVIVSGGIDYGAGVYYSAVYPDWSPNGDRIAFTWMALDGYMNVYGAIYIIKSNLTDTVLVVPFTQNTLACYPSFSLDGTKLIYTLIKSNGAYLNIINDLATHNYTVDIWKYDLVKKANTKLTSDGVSSGGFWGDFKPPAVEDNSSKPQGPEIKIYPNPFTRKTVIEFRVHPPASCWAGSSEFKDLQFGIYNLDGRLVKSFPLTTDYSLLSTAVTWDAQNYPAGIYFLKLRTNGYEKTEKLILIK